jgi:F0F1-type ATP synthase membrane subunit b/b'
MAFNFSEQNIFFIVFFVLVILVAGVCIDILRLLRKERKERREAPRQTDFQPQPYSANEISLRVSERFKKQLEESVEEEIKKNVGNLKNDFQRTSEEIIKNYQSQFKDGGQEIQKIVSEISQQAAEEIKKVSGVLSEELAQKFGGIYQLTKGTLNNKVAETEKEIENYKKERLKEIDRKIYQLLAKVAKKTIGKAIDLSDHEKLVIEALEKAKKEIF